MALLTSTYLTDRIFNVHRYVLTLLLYWYCYRATKNQETANYLYLWQSSKGGQTNIHLLNIISLCFVLLLCLFTLFNEYLFYSFFKTFFFLIKHICFPILASLTLHILHSQKLLFSYIENKKKGKASWFLLIKIGNECGIQCTSTHMRISASLNTFWWLMSCFSFNELDTSWCALKKKY